MSRISRSKAESVSRKLTKKRWDEIESTKKKLAEKASEALLSLCPKEVIECFQTDAKSYLKTDTSLYINQLYVNLYKAIPVKSGNIKLEDKVVSKEITDLYYLAEKQKEDVLNLEREIEETLISLGSYKKIQETFPEAAEFLGIEVRHLPAINLDSIREKLK